MFATAEARTVRISHETIASLIGAHRVTVSGVLRELQRRKAIRLSRERITLLDRQLLRNAAAH